MPHICCLNVQFKLLKQITWQWSAENLHSAQLCAEDLLPMFDNSSILKFEVWFRYLLFLVGFSRLSAEHSAPVADNVISTLHKSTKHQQLEWNMRIRSMKRNETLGERDSDSENRKNSTTTPTKSIFICLHVEMWFGVLSIAFVYRLQFLLLNKNVCSLFSCC